MITLKIHGKAVLQIEEASVEKILSIYPDEHLYERSVFSDALVKGEISLADLRRECGTLLIPWQLFLLQSGKLDRSIEQIEARRNAKFHEKLIASRKKDGSGISLRIADRVIGLQEFASSNINQPNDFCGMLNNHDRNQWPQVILKHFEIDPAKLKNRPKKAVLEYLIKQAEAKNIRVARGVLSTAAMLFPVAREIQKTYRKSSGFVVHDPKLPYVFLPDEMGDNETTGRQILTLLVLLVLVGTNKYDIYLTGNLELRIHRDKILAKAFGVATDILLPHEVSDTYKGVVITESIRDELAAAYMLSPSAVVVTLKQRDIIESDEEQTRLLDSIETGSGGGGPMNSPKIDTSIKKLCGESTTADIVNALSDHKLKTVDAQYLMFGRIDKLRFAKFAATAGL